MDQETKYRLEKKIKELERENTYLANRLHAYEMSVRQIFDGIVEVVSNGKGLNTGWVLGRIKMCLK